MVSTNFTHLDWEDRTTYQYLPQNNLPYHPLEGMGMIHWEIGIVPRKFRKSKAKKMQGMVGMDESVDCTRIFLMVWTYRLISNYDFT